jgi:hypothetical protein
MFHLPDGKRRRRHSANQNRRRWYAYYRSIRFRRRFGFGDVEVIYSACLMHA